MYGGIRNGTRPNREHPAKKKEGEGGTGGWQRKGRTQTHGGTGQSTGESTHTEVGTDLKMKNENRKECLYPRSRCLNEAKLAERARLELK